MQCNHNLVPSACILFMRNLGPPGGWNWHLRPEERLARHLSGDRPVIRP
jgi:hypothetical protein